MERKLRWVNFMGANGCGKSTRTFYLIEYMKKNFNYELLKYTIERKGGSPKEEIIGLKFSNGWVVLGKTSKNDTQWVGLDAGFLSKWQERYEFVNFVYNNMPDIHTIFVEGYFNNRSQAGSPDKMRENTKITNFSSLIAYYDDISEFLERTNGRTGKDRGLDWAENSAGWRDNNNFIKMEKLHSEQIREGDLVERVDIHASKDFLIKKFFNTNYEISDFGKTTNNPPNTTPNLEEEW